MQLTLPILSPPTDSSALAAPESYRGLYGFHKYWGKKPAEPLRYLVQRLSCEGGLIVDPFLGSGTAALESLRLKRRFVGIDINPAAVRIALFLVSPPSAASVQDAFQRVSISTKKAILESYATGDHQTATHYLWRSDKMEQIWVAGDGRRTRTEFPPSEHDITLAERFSSYLPHRLQRGRFFSNSRINSSASLTLRDLFSGRALRNLELLLESIDQLPPHFQEPMRLCLTAAAGQMSKMVFAITGRGKTHGTASGRMEVGSWVIGYWRPEQHFEINVWNCFARRAQKLIKALSDGPTSGFLAKPGTLSSVCAGEADYTIIGGDTLSLLPQVPDRSVNLVITDPPHGDRIPYLELSEMWNVLLDEQPPFEEEIVISNAKERAKNKQQYNDAMSCFLTLAAHKLTENGALVLFFNARTGSSWSFLDEFFGSADNVGMAYRGCFPLVYSASSVVQDNRDGALRTDYGLVFSRSGLEASRLTDIPGWMTSIPTPTQSL